MAGEEAVQYHFYGTPLEDEVESSGHHKDVKDAASSRALPVWKQEVTDEEGRRRFHGAFTGGYSAGYYNTVGSLEGWQPSTFKSSRDKRAGQTQQNVADYMDSDEVAELQKTSLQTTADYDTFGSTAAEVARRQTQQEAEGRPSAIPGAVIEDIIVPVPDSMGIRLLSKMGWRQGRGVGRAGTSSAEGQPGRRCSRWGREAGVGAENTPLHEVAAKADLHGLGFDPFRDAEEFRVARQHRGPAGGPQRQAGPTSQQQLQQQRKRTRGTAFGVGALDEDDSYGVMDDYVVDTDTDKSGAHHFELREEGEEDAPTLFGRLQPRSGRFQLAGQAETLLLQQKGHGQRPGALIAGFVPAQEVQAPVQFEAPRVPKTFGERHVFVVLPPPPGKACGQLCIHNCRPDLEANAQTADQQHCHWDPYTGVSPPAGSAATGVTPPGAQPAPPPADPAVRRSIDTLAPYVARNGPSFEALARERHADDPAFAFLRGGEGAAFYQQQVHLLRDSDASQNTLSAVARRRAPLSADERGELLGEEALPGALQVQAEGEQQQAGHERRQRFVPPTERPVAGYVPSGPSAARPNLAGIAQGDRLRLQQSLQGSFERGAVQDMTASGLPVGQVPGLQPRTLPPPPAAAAGGTAGGGNAAPSGLAAALPPAAQAMLAAMGSRFAASTGGREVLGIVEGGLQQAAGGVRQPTSQGAATQKGALTKPTRRAEEWRPAPLLCKRFNVPDPYKGRPQAEELHMSRFKTDYVALPDTEAAAAAAAGAGAGAAAAGQPVPQLQLPPAPAEPPAAEEQLPGPPARQPHQPQAPAAADAAGAPPDSKAMAEAFLASLGAGPGPPPAAAGGAAQAAAAPEQQRQAAAALSQEAQPAVETPLERPIDLFKAIFEDSEEGSGEDSGASEDEEPAQTLASAAPVLLSAAEGAGSAGTGALPAGKPAVGQLPPRDLRALGAEAGPQQPAQTRWDRDHGPQAPQQGRSLAVWGAQPASQVPQQGQGAAAQATAPSVAVLAGQQPQVQEILAALQKHRDGRKGRHKDKKSSKDGASQKRKRKGSDRKHRKEKKSKRHKSDKKARAADTASESGDSPQVISLTSDSD